MEKFEELVIKASHILDIAERYQWELGQLSNEVVKTYGYKALVDFAKQIQENCGIWRSPGSLRMYAYVYKVSSKLNLPEDILFSACQAIIFSGNPVKYAKMVQDGMSGTEIRKVIYNDKKS